MLAGKKVLIVDDDIRNIFALTSILEWRNMAIVSAETGRARSAILQAQPDIDIVLMDIMMPEMDGIDTMRAIRLIPRFKSLPIIAVTAKAMKGDREKCIEAGAWDYLSKPVETEQLLSSLRAVAAPLAEPGPTEHDRSSHPFRRSTTGRRGAGQQGHRPT